MQIRYQITLVYTVIVTIILSILCSSIYFFSYQNRTQQFQDRLIRKAGSTADLLFKYHLNNKLVREINLTSPSSLVHKAIIVYDSSHRPIFSYYEPSKDSFMLNPSVFKDLNEKRYYYFKIKNKEAVLIKYRFNNRDYFVFTAAHDAEKEDWLPKLRFILFISFFISISIVVVSGYVFSLRLIKSISRLTNKINHISSVEFAQRLPSGSGKDELQQLAITINDLLDRLQSSFDTQRRFIENASHELVTPLASIGSQIDVALQRERSMDDYKQVLSSVSYDVKRLGALVKSLLEMAKLTSGSHGLDQSPVRIDELLMRLPSEMKKINPRFEVKLLFDELPENESELSTCCNEELLFSAIKNMVHNACKYSTDKTAIVTLRFANGKVIIRIEDHGPGIHPEEYERIFQPFYRSADINNLISGTGLGLPLANYIIRLYNGTIELDSKVNRGSIFTITLKTESAFKPHKGISHPA